MDIHYRPLLIIEVRGKESLRRMIDQTVKFDASDGRVATNTDETYFAHVKTKKVGDRRILEYVI